MSKTEKSEAQLVGGLDHFFHILNILGISSSQPPFMIFRVVGQPPTRQDHEANLTFDIHGFMGVLGGSSWSAGLLTQG